MDTASQNPHIVPKRQSFAPGFVTVTPRAAHLVVIKLTSTWLDCRIADRHVQHETSFGSIAILPNGADCSAMVDRGTAETLTLTIDAAALGHFLRGGEEQAELQEVLSGHDVPLANLALSLSQTDPSDDVARDRWVHKAMVHITARYATAGPVPHPGSLSRSTMEAVRAFIFDNIDGELSIANLAAAAGLSPYHFCRAFARTTGISPHRYIMQARADQAAAAIRIGRQSLAHIACAYGFTDQSHMCRWINRRYASTPTALRKLETIGPVGTIRGQIRGLA